ncbi:uncharacterized protein LOC134819534 isoform X2 [Bolinopsis microptera]|uniref:uncharacterized protein LOC134819534 isoform X2 n=1 Tax=Bolinopsis microptera TaxID=2820187 RepID=UPI00307A94E0
MSFSSLLEEANHTLESDCDVNDTQWSIDSNSSNTLPSPCTPASAKPAPQSFPNLNQSFSNGLGQKNGSPNPDIAHYNAFQNTNLRQHSSYDVKAEPNPFYGQNGLHNTFVNQVYQQPVVQQRTHLPIQFDEYYNLNSLPRQEYIVNNHNQQLLYQQHQKSLVNNTPPPNVKPEKSRKRANKKSEPRKKIKIEFNGAPPNWKALYDNIMEMRKNIVAPVDVMGCFKNAESDKGPKIYRYQVMISLMLSSQTKDEVTAGAMKRLKKFGLTPKNVADTDESVLAQLIHPVGFWQKKATYIKNASRIVHTEYDNDIPNTVEGLTSLPGIGPKMAHLCMEFAWNKLTGISVDTHVHRICQRLGWTPAGLKHPDDTRKLLEHWLPKEEWGRINLMMVGFGQVVCLPTKPRCFECKNKDICPYAKDNPERTNKKASQTSRPSARSQKTPKDEKVETKPRIKAEKSAKQMPEHSTPYNTGPTPTPYNTGPTPGTPLLTPPLQPPHPEMSSLRPLHLTPDSYMYPHYQQPYPPNYLKPEPDHMYQTLTPSASPHGPYEAGTNPFYQHPGNGNYNFPGSFFPSNNGSYPVAAQGPVSSPCVQSPMIDTTTSSPLINPFSNTEEGNRAPGESDPLRDKSNNVLDNFLDW